MLPNLRSVVERVTRGGRIVAAARLMSLLEKRTKSPGVFQCFATGFCFYLSLEMFKVATYYEAMEEEKLQRLRDEQVLNAGQHDLSHTLK